MLRIIGFAALGLAISALVFGGTVNGSLFQRHPGIKATQASVDPFSLMAHAPRDLPKEQYSGH